jgi:hypothetical protein
MESTMKKYTALTSSRKLLELAMRGYHKFLYGQLASCMLSSIYNIH